MYSRMATFRTTAERTRDDVGNVIERASRAGAAVS
jgi:hypothetical protein